MSATKTYLMEQNERDNRANCHWCGEYNGRMETHFQELETEIEALRQRAELYKSALLAVRKQVDQWGELSAFDSAWVSVVQALKPTTNAEERE